jgi:uncharacterized protein YbjT (DUF2867 family)
LRDPHGFAAGLDGVGAVFVLWPFLSADGAPELVDALAAPDRGIAYLSAEAAGRRPDSFWAKLDRAIEGSTSPVDISATHRAGRQHTDVGRPDPPSDVVRWVYGQAARSLIDERDIAEVAIRALTEPGHDTQRYVLTGPEPSHRQLAADGVADGMDLVCAGRRSHLRPSKTSSSTCPPPP